MMKVNDIRKHFIEELKNENFTVDRSGQKTIELIGASFEADEEAIFGKVNQDYVNDELDWYKSQSTNIYDIRPDAEPPSAWLASANKHGEINSNYGKLIYDDKYYTQYHAALDELIFNPDSRRATMIYTRPSIWMEWNENNKNDFICTNAVTYYYRNNTIDAVVQMRSNDVVYGYKNDYAWQKYVLENFKKDYELAVNVNPGEIHLGKIIWQVQNLHVYERHFNLVK